MLNELATYAPGRYEEIIEFLPRTRYNRRWVQRYYGSQMVALTDGYVAIDAEDYGYDMFRFAVLREPDHNLQVYRSDDYRNDRRSGDAIDELAARDADRYASVDTREINACQSLAP